MNGFAVEEAARHKPAGRLRILHVGAEPSPQSVSGVNIAIWGLASAQARLGLEVTLLLDQPPDQEAARFAKQAGLNLIYIRAAIWSHDPKSIRRLLVEAPPQIVHFHSVFIPKQARLAAELVKWRIPYIITPHGGTAPVSLRRGKLRKKLYSFLIERRRFRRAAALTVVTPGEADDVRGFVPQYRGEVKWVPNPMESSLLEDTGWTGRAEPKRLVFLGRFDVYVKGIDILIEIARHLPDVAVDLYGTEDSKTRADLAQLRRELPANACFHAPVFGAEKLKVMAEASMYIQTSRVEGFPLSVAEAMCLRVPCAVTDSLKFAELFRDHDLGLLLPSDPRQAAQRLARALSNPEQLRGWSQRAGAFARNHFHPQMVANRYLELYQSVLNDRTWSHTASRHKLEEHGRMENT